MRIGGSKDQGFDSLRSGKSKRGFVRCEGLIIWRWVKTYHVLQCNNDDDSPMLINGYKTTQYGSSAIRSTCHYEQTAARGGSFISTRCDDARLHTILADPCRVVPPFRVVGCRSLDCKYQQSSCLAEFRGSCSYQPGVCSTSGILVHMTDDTISFLKTIMQIYIYIYI